MRKAFSCFPLQSDGRKLVQRSAGSELMTGREESESDDCFSSES